MYETRNTYNFPPAKPNEQDKITHIHERQLDMAD